MAGSSFSRYEPIAPIGTGGMATVFVARTRGAVGFSRLVALKRAHSHVKNDEKLAASMKLEAHLASRLHHANVVSVLDVEEDDGDLVLVLDYVEGCTLRTLALKLDKLREHRPREILRIVLDVAAGLHAAHQTTDEHGRLLGLVHRDVSPSNVLVGVDGIARIADFGIAKAIIEGSDRTETGILKGKSSYMAPEYVMHQRASAASDLFSLGVVAWEALANERLFKGPNEIETLKRVMAADVRPLTAIRRELAPIEHILNRALARSPSDRYGSVDAMASELAATTRKYDLLATHAEVSALVERVARIELEERRRLLRDGGRPVQEDIETVIASSPLLRAAREDRAPISTTSAPPSSRIPQAPSSGREKSVRVPVASASRVPVPSSSRMPVPSSSRMPVPAPPASSRMSPVPPARMTPMPSSPRMSAAAASVSRMSVRQPIAASTALPITSVTPPPPPAPAEAAPRVVVHREARSGPPDRANASRGRGREMLALAGAFVLLGIALTVMAVELGKASSDDESPTVVVAPTSPPSVTASVSASASTEPSASASAPPSASDSASEAPSTSASARHPRRPPRH